MTKRIIHLTCNHCRAEFDLDLEHAQTECPFCGGRVMIGIDKLLEILAQQAVPVQEELPIRGQFGVSGTEQRYDPTGKEYPIRGPFGVSGIERRYEPTGKEYPIRGPFGVSGAEQRYEPAGKEYPIREAPAVPQPFAGSEPDDAPKWYDPPIEEEPEWKQIWTALFRILVICTPLVIVLRAISGAPVFIIIGVILIFLFLIYLAKR